MARELTLKGQIWRSWMPVVLRDSPDHLAVIHACAREVERLEGKVEQVRMQFFPQHADVLLKVWEFMLRVTVEPEGLTVEQRRALVIATLRKMRSTPYGRDWVANVTALVGEGWTYEEHEPGVGTSPPTDTIRINLPFPPDSSSYARAEALIRAITPAHVDIVLANPEGGGFILDQSELDQEAVL